MAECLMDFSILEQIATLIWAHTGNSHLAEKLSIMKLGKDVWTRVSRQDEMELLRGLTILGICQYVQEHPRASPAELTREVGQRISDFSRIIERM